MLGSKWLIEVIRPVVLKRVPLDLLREEFLIPRRKFVRVRNWGGKAVDEKTRFLWFIYSTHKELHNEVGLDEKMSTGTQGQTALTAVTDVLKRTAVTDVHNRLLFLHNR